MSIPGSDVEPARAVNWRLRRHIRLSDVDVMVLQEYCNVVDELPAIEVERDMYGVAADDEKENLKILLC